jgi:hypothetical protein
MDQRIEESDSFLDGDTRSARAALPDCARRQGSDRSHVKSLNDRWEW